MQIQGTAQSNIETFDSKNVAAEPGWIQLIDKQ